MAHAAATADTPFAAPPAADDAALLSRLAGFSLAYARAIQAKGVQAAHDGDFDRACAAEVRFSRFALGIRRAIVLTSGLRRQRDAADPAADDLDAAMLSELAQLGVAFAQAIQVRGAEAADFDTLCAMETHYSRLALGVRRAVALKAKLRQRQEAARHQAEDRRDQRQRETAERRQQVAEGVVQAIAAAKPDPADAEDRERLTADLWDRLAEAERIDTDRPDTVLPIEVLVRRMCRDLGIPHAWPAVASGAAAAEDGEDEVCTASGFRYRRGRFRRVPSAELGRPETEPTMLDTETGEVFPPLPDPAAPPAPATGPPPTDGELIDAEIRRREPAAWDQLRVIVHRRISALG